MTHRNWTLLLIWHRSFFKNKTQWIDWFFLENMTQRIEPFHGNMTQRIEPFLFLNMTHRIGPSFLHDSKNWTFFLHDSKNWTFFTWLKDLGFFFPKIRLNELIDPCWKKYDSKNWTFFEYDPKNWTLLVLQYDSKNWTFFFFQCDSRNCLLKKYVSKNWTFSNLTQRLERFFFFSMWLKRIEPYFSNITQRIEPLLKNMSQTIGPFLYVSKNWTFFKESNPFVKYDAKNWTFVKYDSKNWTPFFGMWLRELNLFFFGMWPKELNFFLDIELFFFWQTTLRIEPFCEYVPKNWTLFWIWLKELNLLFSRLKELVPFQYDSKNRTFSGMRLKELNFIFECDSKNWTLFLNVSQRIEFCFWMWPKVSTGETIFSILRPPDLCLTLVFSLQHICPLSQCWCAHMMIHQCTGIGSRPIERKTLSHLCTHLTITFAVHIRHGSGAAWLNS